MGPISRFFNDGSGAAPSLRVYLNLDNLVDLRADTIWPGLEGLPRYQRLKDDGFEGVNSPSPPRRAGTCLTVDLSVLTLLPKLTRSLPRTLIAPTGAPPSTLVGDLKMT